MSVAGPVTGGSRRGGTSSGSGLPAGGTTGQALRKIDATDGNAEWANQPAGNFTTASGTSTQSGGNNTQSGGNNTQSGGNNTQSGYYNTQSGYYNTQSGGNNTQSGGYNNQSGQYNTQSGGYGAQSGQYLDDGGFNFTAMFGNAKTATVDNRAYFAMDNGIWLKPVTADPATLEKGVIWFDDVTNKLKFYNGTSIETVTSA